MDNAKLYNQKLQCIGTIKWLTTFKHDLRTISWSYLGKHTCTMYIHISIIIKVSKYVYKFQIPIN